MLVVYDHLFTFKEEKGMIFFKNWRHRGNVPPILLNGIPLPWVDRMKHLGNWEHTPMLKHYYMVPNEDLKRAKFVGKIKSLNQDRIYT
jgi:hypothetical protein